ncbi:MAG TPA: ATP-binding protein [Minicystis sp.]|nr:ATP-binding protein [Minicystis sp.]
MSAEASGSILYVDADAEARPVVRRFLERCARLRVAETLVEARRELAREAPALLVVDPDLPDGDGIELVQEATAAHPWMQVFVVAPAKHAARAASFIAAGASDIAVKPFDVGTLVGRVTRHLRAAEAAHKELVYRRELESRLAHAERIASLGTLCATVAHEIANPLSLVIANAEVLARDLAGSGPLPAPERASLSEATEDIRTAARLIEAFLSRVRTFSRRRDVERVTAPVSSAVDTALLFLKPRLAGGAVRVRHVETGAFEAPHDPVRLAQAVLNVLGNAVDAIGAEPGTVTVSYEDLGPRAAIVVDDDGPGIAPEAEGHLFEPFFTTKARGTGLGLLLVQSIVREHGGVFELVPRPGGRGTRARFTLPKS